ncbi:hypothetical protein [Arthrobacter sp. FW306-04-A]|uniref:hypothetical protein n=1 Tax=Arthrobacter sp. FW306-04-A TaxID=2879619 RepID=UPI0037BE9648|nr:hypothetical protein LFT43_09030 [Arthrobacter sp. FW306-04-A]
MMDPAADLAAEPMRLPSRNAYLQATSQLLLKLFPSDLLAWNDLDAEMVYAKATE